MTMAHRQSGTLKFLCKKSRTFYDLLVQKCHCLEIKSKKKQMEYSEVTPLIGITKASLNDMILLKYCFISLLPPIRIASIANCSKEPYVSVLFVVSRVNEWRVIVWLARYFSLALPHCKATFQHTDHFHLNASPKKGYILHNGTNFMAAFPHSSFAFDCGTMPFRSCWGTNRKFNFNTHEWR